jgi:hypothetical protein
LFLIQFYLRQLIINFNESNLCSGELFESKFIVPCNPEEYLSFQYGKDKWRKPFKYGYFNMETFNDSKTWSDQDWPHVLKYYYRRDGKFSYDQTLDAINKFANPKYDSLPKDVLIEI